MSDNTYNQYIMNTPIRQYNGTSYCQVIEKFTVLPNIMPASQFEGQLQAMATADLTNMYSPFSQFELYSNLENNEVICVREIQTSDDTSLGQAGTSNISKYVNSTVQLINDSTLQGLLTRTNSANVKFLVNSNTNISETDILNELNRLKDEFDKINLSYSTSIKQNVGGYSR